MAIDIRRLALPVRPQAICVAVGDVEENSWEVYEAEKKPIIARYLPLDEQDAEIQALVRRLGL